MQHVELYTDTCNILFEMISCSIRQNKYARIFNGTNTVFSNSKGPWAKASERWENPYAASSACGQRSAYVVRAQCTPCEAP